MATILNFEDLEVWQKAQSVTVELYKEFELIKNFSFKDQIFRASLSISNNIAEGFDRGYNTEFIRFLKISKGSASEVKSMIYLAQKLGYISEEKQKYYLEQLVSINKMLNGLIKAVTNYSQKTG